ncbi:MAG: hypothetical protein WEG40_12815 [Candidatus Rokuibacteriota bacterium]
MVQGAQRNTRWGYTLSEVAKTLSQLTDHPIGGDDVLDLIHVGYLDPFVVLTELSQGRLRFDPSLSWWFILFGELAGLVAETRLTQTESEQILQDIGPKLPDAFLKAARLINAGRRPRNTRVVAIVKTGRRTKRIPLAFLRYAIDMLANAYAH